MYGVAIERGCNEAERLHPSPPFRGSRVSWKIWAHLLALLFKAGRLAEKTFSCTSGLQRDVGMFYLLELEKYNKIDEEKENRA